MKKFFYFLSLVFCISLNAQITTSSQWTWMKGDNTAKAAGVYGTQGVASAANKPGGRLGSVSWKDALNNVWVFGGYDANFNFLNELWKYTPSTNQWTWVKGDNTVNQQGIYGIQGTPAAANMPGARTYSTAWTDSNGNFWLFGGDGHAASGTSFTRLNDLWKYSPSTNQWTWVKGDSIGNQLGVYGTPGTAATANKPGARTGSVAWTDVAGNLWLLGGYGLSAGSFGYLNDFWKYSPSTNQWTWINGDNTVNQQGIYGVQGIPATSNKPGARQGSVAWTDIAGSLWLFGGIFGGINNSFNNLNDLWKYTPSTNQWTWIKGDNIVNQQGVYGIQGTPVAANKPGARYYGTTWVDDTGSFWLFGGTNLSPNYVSDFNDLWNYTPSTNQWTWVKGDSTLNQQGVYGTQGTPAVANKPGARGYNVAWADNAAGSFWLFGGYGYPASGFGQLNDVWKLSNVSTLPITLSSVKAYQENAHIAVEWKVQNESGIKQYNIEKSINGTTFNHAATQAALYNNTRGGTYTWIDVNPTTGNNFYRIRSEGGDGGIKYSQVVKVTTGKAKSGYEVYPNPVSNGIIQLQFINQVKGTYGVRLLNSIGQIILNNQIVHEAGSSTEAIQFNSRIPKGSYIVEISAPDKSRQSIHIIY